MRHKSRKTVHVTFVLYLVGGTFWASCAFLLYGNILPGSTDLVSRLMLIAGLYTAASYCHFLHAVIKQPRGPGVILGYGMVIILIPFIATKQIPYVITEHVPLGIGLIATGCVLLAGWAIFKIIQEHRHSNDPIVYNRIIYLVAGFVLLLVFCLTKLHPAFAKYPMAQLGNLCNALIITFAIVRYRMLDINFVLRNTLTHAATGLAFMTLYIVLILSLLQYLAIEITPSTLLASAIVAALISILYYPMRKYIQEFIERLMYRETYDYRQMLLAFSKQMSHVLNLNELAEGMLKLIARALKVEEANLFLPDNENSDFVSHFHLPPTNGTRAMKLTRENPLVTWLAKASGPLSREQIDILPQMKALRSEERKQIDKSGINFLFPIKSRDTLVGILTLGNKENGARYRSEDLDLVTTMASSAGVVIENAQLYAAANVKANTDELTSLYNHRYFHQRLDEEIARGLRFGVIFSLILFDLDLFKRYNDIQGHLAGDELLRRVGKSLRSALRTVDMAFRYGGDEFAVILPGTSTEDALKVAERIRQSIEQAMDSEGFMLTASLGVASWPTDGMMKESLIQCADSALYHAKQWGNRTCLYADATASDLIQKDPTEKQGVLNTIYALAATVDARDQYTYGHSKKVSNISVAIGEAISLDAEKIARLRTTALLHDIGKIGIADELLNKSDKLTEDEWKPIHSHPTLGVSILKHIVGLAPCLPGIQYHHERYDGAGYPYGLAGNNIPLEARIIAIADAYEAMTAPRPYRTRPLTSEEALEEIKKNAGTQFDPELAKVFCRLYSKPQLETAGAA
jgi:diguanylate cyclase (GGDEF)-like protein